MAFAKKCDRCGKLYECWPIGNIPGVYNAIVRLRKADDGSIRTYATTTMDFCPKCMNDLDRFMRVEKIMENRENKDE